MTHGEWLRQTWRQIMLLPSIDGQPVQAVVFRLSPNLLIAPAFIASDRGFAAAELRAWWAHVLALPHVASVNRSNAETWFGFAEPGYWRSYLTSAGVAVAPLRLGLPGDDGWWIRWSGEVATMPDSMTGGALGAAWVMADELRPVLCCAGEPVGGDPELRPAASALLRAGIVLSELIVDSRRSRGNRVHTAGRGARLG